MRAWIVVATALASACGSDVQLVPRVTDSRDAGLDASAPDTTDAETIDAAPSCTAPKVACHATCVSTSDDPLHCGGCDRPCARFQACVAGGCTCTACGGACTDVSSDPIHCGRCDQRCADNQYCVLGSCVCRASLLSCSGTCAEPSSPSSCGKCGVTCRATEVCTGSACDVGCPSGKMLCSGACIDINSDPSHCGGCTTACLTNEVCVAASCKPYVIGTGCASCPCAACDGKFSFTSCCPALPGHSSVLCVSASAIGTAPRCP